MRTGSDWSGGAAPASGDTAIIGSGTVLVRGEGQGVNVRLAGANGANPTLNLQNSAVGQIELGGLTQFAEAGTIAVTGSSSIDGISEGGLREQTGALTIRLGSYATLANVGTANVLNGSTLTESGGAHALFVNNGTINTSISASLKFGTEVAGTGTIVDGNGPVYLGGSTIEFARAVGAGQTITLDKGTLQIDKPMQFHATVAPTTTAASLPGGNPSTASLGDGAIVLEQTYADSALFSGTELVLKHAHATVADLHLSGLPTDGTAQLWVGREADGSTAVTGFALPGSQALQVSTVPVLLS